MIQLVFTDSFVCVPRNHSFLQRSGYVRCILDVMDCDAIPIPCGDADTWKRVFDHDRPHVVKDIDMAMASFVDYDHSFVDVDDRVMIELIASGASEGALDFVFHHLLYTRQLHLQRHEVDLLMRSDHINDFYWILSRLPSHVRIVLSIGVTSGSQHTVFNYLGFVSQIAECSPSLDPGDPVDTLYIAHALKWSTLP